MNAIDLKLDYFKFYDVGNLDAQADVTLRGQFDRRALPMRVRLLDFFANPVSKNGEPMFDKNAHLAWYRGVQPAEPIRKAIVENQFGRFEIRTGTGYGLLVPTQKIEKGSSFPERLDHFKVYRLVDVEKVPNIGLKLEDQFGTGEAKLLLPLYFAVPAAKKHGEVTTKIINERAHLLIFSISSRPADKRIRLRNQFGSAVPVTVIRSVMLGVPSVKLEWSVG